MPELFAFEHIAGPQPRHEAVDRGEQVGGRIDPVDETHEEGNEAGALHLRADVGGRHEGKEEKADELGDKIRRREPICFFRAFPRHCGILIGPEDKGTYVDQHPGRVKGKEAVPRRRYVDDPVYADDELDQLVSLIGEKIHKACQDQWKNGVGWDDLSQCASNHGESPRIIGPLYPLFPEKSTILSAHVAHERQRTAAPGS